MRVVLKTYVGTSIMYFKINRFCPSTGHSTTLTESMINNNNSTNTFIHRRVGRWVLLDYGTQYNIANTTHVILFAESLFVTGKRS